MIPIDQIFNLLINYGYLILFPIMVIEGPIITIICGFLVSLGILNPYTVYIVIVFADLFGDFIYYSLGRWKGKKFLERFGKYVGITPENIKKLENHFGKHARKTLIIGKITHAIGEPILFAAGVTKVPIKDFLWYNFLATLPKTLFLLLIGFYFGQAYVQLNEYLDYFSAIIVSLLIIVFILMKFRSRVKKRYNRIIEKISKIDLTK